MSWTERPLAEGFALELTGHAIGAELPGAERRAIHDAVTRHGVVVLPGQSLSDDALYDFANSLGPTIKMPSALDGVPGAVTRLSNLDAAGRLLPPSANPTARANMLWHLDLTFQRPRATLSMLFGVTVPPSGGETEFCDLRRAWKSLPPEEQNELEGLTASHSYIHSRTRAGFTDWTPEHLSRFRPVERPLVRAHEETGRKAILLASHIEQLSGHDRDESAARLASLVERATVAENCYSHRWREGDLVIWDNRCVMHRAMPFESDRFARDMRTVRLIDTEDITSPPSRAHP